MKASRRMHTLRSSKARIVITAGDPSGVGAEVALKALASPKISGLANFLLIGDAYVIETLKKDMKLKPKVPLLDLGNVPPKTFRYGALSAAFGKASLEYIDKALEIIKSGEADALVTAPVNKLAIKSSGVSDFEGHTEYLAAHTGAKDVAMMFVGKSLKVTLVTRHTALKDVPGALSPEHIYRTIMLTHKYLKDFFGIRNPRIGVSGLNPHAGEGGIFGDEEKTLISPAIKKALQQIAGVSGPIPPDVIFYECLNKKFDAVVAMYHDQALIPFKMLYFKEGVNLTLGLPFIRTSPDHGTAFDIAGKGIADPTSMAEAIMLACRLADKKRCSPKAG